MNKLQLTIATPEGNAFYGQAGGLFLRGSEGELAILPGHIPFVTAVKPGTCRILMEDGLQRSARTDGGLLSASGESVMLLSGSFHFLTESI